MIVTTKKNVKEIISYVSSNEGLIIVGCSECAASCQTGGSKQVEEMAQQMGIHRVIATISIHAPCDKRIASRDLKRIDDEIKKADVLIALTCGSGVQAISEVTGKKVIAALNTHFLRMVERIGRFYERCAQCGDCILNDTGGICPYTRCPRKVRNGPCEFIAGIMCDVHPHTECVWHLIFTRLKQNGEEKRFTVFHPPLQWENRYSPQEVVW
ncbi:MAG: methylenetetrahydrofolate reductase C-terminal domain-containing protein [Spirochaetes bacterium]|nr:methylenetetrahydrofolate reductase C-terminal domain-containing protein [Spirochaetota bacterium]